MPPPTDTQLFKRDVSDFVETSKIQLLPILLIVIFLINIGVLVCASLIYSNNMPEPSTTVIVLLALSSASVFLGVVAAMYNKHLYGELLPHNRLPAK
jgi:hypothetical protein